MEHIARHLRQRVRAGRRSGLAGLVVFAPMVVTGYLIQAVIDPAFLAAVSWTHVATGVALPLALPRHHKRFRSPRAERRLRRTAGA